jgi:hypothetical protein
MASRVTSTGTTIALGDVAGQDHPVVTLHNPANGDDEALTVGRVIDGGFQPQPLAALLFPFVMSPECLRTIADLVEEWDA